MSERLNERRWLFAHAGVCALILAMTGAFAPAQDSAPQPAPDAGTTDAKPVADSGRIARLNQAFLRHLEALGEDKALAVATIRSGYDEYYRGQAPQAFVPEALAVLNPTFRATLERFDGGDAAGTLRLAERLIDDDDPFVSASAVYFYARSQADLGRLEEAEAFIRRRVEDWETYGRHTPFAPHLMFVLAYSQTANLRYDDARETLNKLDALDAPGAAIEFGVRQLTLEIERREQGTLGEVADLMDYSAQRLGAADASDRVQKKQDEIIELLDQLIEQAEQQERQQQGGGQGGSQQGRQDGQPTPGQTPSSPAERSKVMPGMLPGVLGPPRANPGDAWGKLPPAEREKILQSIRERYPSRYRQLVEQYYRALAEQE